MQKDIGRRTNNDETLVCWTSLQSNPLPLWKSMESEGSSKHVNHLTQQGGIKKTYLNAIPCSYKSPNYAKMPWEADLRCSSMGLSMCAWNLYSARHWLQTCFVRKRLGRKVWGSVLRSTLWVGSWLRRKGTCNNKNTGIKVVLGL